MSVIIIIIMILKYKFREDVFDSETYVFVHGVKGVLRRY